MRKIAPVAFLTAGFLLFGGLLSSPAFADDEDDREESTSFTSPKPRESHPPKIEDSEDSQDEVEDESHEADEKAKHKELREKYGTSGKFLLPPLVIRPKHSMPKPTLSPEAGVVSSGAVGSGESAGGLVSETGSFGSASLGNFIAVNPSSALTGYSKDSTGTAVNPEQNVPIDITTVNFNQKTPIAVFIEAAKVGLGAMTVGVLALGLTVGYRAIRRK